MATVNLGNIKFNWKGTYNANTAYAIDDVVSYNGSSYVCISATTGNLPTVTAKWNVMATAGTNGANGTDVGTTITTQGDILYRDGSGLQRLAKGTASQVLKMNTSANAPAWGTLSSDYVKLKTVDITTSTAACDFVHGTNGVVIDNTYKYYKILIASCEPTQQGQTIRLRVGSSGSFANSGYLNESKRSY